MINITLWQNPLHVEGDNNAKWMAKIDGFVHSGDTELQAVEGVLKLYTSRRVE